MNLRARGRSPAVALPADFDSWELGVSGFPRRKRSMNS